MSVSHFIVGVRFLPTILNQPIEKVCFGRKIIKISFSYLMNRITKCIASSGLISVTSVHQHTTNGNADNTNQLFQCKESSFVKVLRWRISDELPSAENVGVILIYHNHHSGW